MRESALAVSQSGLGCHFNFMIYLKQSRRDDSPCNGGYRHTQSRPPPLKRKVQFRESKKSTTLNLKLSKITHWPHSAKLRAFPVLKPISPTTPTVMSSAGSDQQITFTSMGMLVLDELHLPSGQTLQNVVGGSGTFSEFSFLDS